PSQEETTAIDLVQTIVEGPTPRLDPTYFSTELCHFVDHCLQKSPPDRLPAEALLGSTWMTRCGACSLSTATTSLHQWIESLRC
ncbi:unnamed protein product, partial [Choristocarpus tenellus]